jgi:hypothetical protein
LPVNLHDKQQLSLAPHVDSLQEEDLGVCAEAEAKDIRPSVEPGGSQVLLEWEVAAPHLADVGLSEEEDALAGQPSTR